jgi:hypothetical protein
MTKTMTLLLVVGVLLIGTSMASLLADPAQPAKSRKIAAGKASLWVPLHIPGEIFSGTPVSGSVIMGSKDDCDITYDHFTGVYWSDRIIPASALFPTPAYYKVSDQTGGMLDLGQGNMAKTRTIKLSAEKPCGKIVRETLNVIDLYCGSSRTHFAIVGMQDPYMTRQRVEEIAKTLRCP